MQWRLDELTDEWRAIVSELAGGAEISTVAISNDGGCISLQLWVDHAPYVQVYERDPGSGAYKLHATRALGQMKF